MNDGEEPPPLRVVHCIGSLAIGGAERQLVEVIRRLPPERFAQGLVVFQSDGPLLPDVVSTGCPVVGLLGSPSRRRGKHRTVYRAGAAMLVLVRYLIRTRPDVLHAQLPAPNMIALVAGRIARVPIIVTSQVNLCRDPSASTRRQRIENHVLRRSSAVFANSLAVQRDLIEFQGVDPARINVIHNGVDLDRFAPQHVEQRRITRRANGLSEHDRLIVCVANLHPYKGIEDLVEAFALLDPESLGLGLVLVGRDEGAAGPAAERARQLDVDGLVHFVGEVRDVEAFLSIAALVVHPSHEEGFANAIIEAMSAGMPVVACAVGGNGEAIIDGETGRLVPPRRPDLLAAAMGELLVDAERAKAMGAAGRRRIEQRFAMDRMIGELGNWYDSLARKHRRPSRGSTSQPRAPLPE